MLTITVLGEEFFDETLGENGEFVRTEDVVLELEHSLVSLSKWEEISEKPYLGPGERTTEEVLTYVKAMILTRDYPESVLSRLSDKNVEEISVYINKKHTATWFGEAPGAPKSNTETITAELIYYWMTVFNIPWEAQYWHLNKLFTLIKIANLKSDNKPKKMGRQEANAQRRALNAQRKAELGTKG